MKPVAWAIAVFFIVATGCTLWMTYLVTVATKQIYTDTSQKIDQVIKLVDKRSGDVLLATNLTADKTDQRVASIQKDANTQLMALREELNGQLTPITTQASGTIRELSGLVSNISGLIPQISPVLQAATKTVGDTDLLVEGIKPEAVGLLRDTRLASAEFARTSIYIRQQTPVVLKNFEMIETDIKKSTDSAALASQATADTMLNLKRATAPLPSWIRIPLSLTGALAPTAAGVVSSLGATGVFQK